MDALTSPALCNFNGQSEEIELKQLPAAFKKAPAALSTPKPATLID
jgi:hypothetical protein